LNPEGWGSTLVQEKIQEEKTCDKKHKNNVIIIIIIIREKYQEEMPVTGDIHIV